jgi:hypothetical protein
VPIIQNASRAARSSCAPARRCRIVLALLTVTGLGLMLPAAAPAYASRWRPLPGCQRRGGGG